ncbi:hypothetical protein BGX33_008830 [Mortierella sp. NVP41]|nr:hypothetical protein BGX33_008830 [Mortierella sp. NVP41]
MPSPQTSQTLSSSRASFHLSPSTNPLIMNGQFPLELVVEIAKNLDGRALAAARTTCWDWRAVLQPVVWHRFERCHWMGPRCPIARTAPNNEESLVQYRRTRHVSWGNRQYMVLEMPQAAIPSVEPYSPSRIADVVVIMANLESLSIRMTTDRPSMPLLRVLGNLALLPRLKQLDFEIPAFSITESPQAQGTATTLYVPIQDMFPRFQQLFELSLGGRWYTDETQEEQAALVPLTSWKASALGGHGPGTLLP